MAFNWNDHPVADSVPTIENQNPEKEDKITSVPGQSFSWNDHPTVEDTSGTHALQQKAMAGAAQVGEHLLPFGLIPKGVALAKSYAENKPYEQSKNEVRNSLDKIEEPAGILGKVAGLGTELMSSGAGVNMARNALGIAKEAEPASVLMNAIKNQGLTSAQRFKNALPGLTQSTAEGAAIGGVGNALESNKLEEIPHKFEQGAVLGGELGLGAGAIGQLVGKSGVANKYGKAFNMGTEGDRTLGKASEIATNKTSKDTAQLVAENMMNPLEVSGKLYGAELQRAKDLGNTVEPKIGLTQASQEVVQDLPLKKAQEYHQMLVNGQLDPVQAKEYQKLIQSTLNQKMRAPVGQEIPIQNLKALNDSLKAGIDSTLPADRLSKINQIYSGARRGVETFLNNGIENPEFQLHSVSDYNPGEMGGKLVERLRNEVIPNISRVTPSLSGPISDTLESYLQSAGKQENNLNNMIQGIAGEEATSKYQNSDYNLGNIYKNSKINYNVPQSIRMLEDAGNKEAITGATGSYHVGENQAAGRMIKAAISPSEALLTAASSIPYHIANTVGVAMSPVRKMANALEAHPVFSSVGKSLNDALNNPSDTAKNAVLMKIMQNPSMKKALGMDKKDENGGNP